MKTWVTLGLLASFAGSAMAETDVEANFNLAITGASYSGCGDPLFDFIDASACSDLTTPGLDGTAFVWIVATHEGGFTGGGIGGAQFGIEYTGVTQNGWTLCTGGSEIPDGTWPASGSGNAVTWSEGCYAPSGGAARVGFFSVADGDAGDMAVTTDPRIGEAQWADCAAALYTICENNLASAALVAGTVPVCGDRCEGEVPTIDASWAQIKALY